MKKLDDILKKLRANKDEEGTIIEEIESLVAESEHALKTRILAWFDENQRTYDTAVPQEWANEVRDLTGVYLPGQVVWMYVDGDTFGKPFPLTEEAALTLNQLRDEHDWKV